MGEPDPPPAYLLHPPPPPAERLVIGDTLRFGLTLLGDAVPFAPAVIWALYRYGLYAGLSRERRRCLLIQATAQTPAGEVPIFSGRGGPAALAWDDAWTWSARQYLERRLCSSVPRRGELTLLTPLELREQGRPVEVLTFQHVVRSLLRNVSAHLRVHGGQSLEGVVDFRALKEASSMVTCTRDGTDWLRIERDSSRQQRTIPIDTRVGWLRFEGELEPFIPWLELGTVLGLGKGRSHGFGNMRWEQ